MLYFGNFMLYKLAKLYYFFFPAFQIFLILHRAESKSVASFYLHMSIEMFYTFYNSLTFPHIRTSSKCNCISFLSTTNRCMWLMCITPFLTGLQLIMKAFINIPPYLFSSQNHTFIRICKSTCFIKHSSRLCSI